MKLATTTSVLSRRADIAPKDALFAEMALSRAAGFTSLDLRLSSQAKAGYPLAENDWERWAEQIGLEAQRLGLDFPQAHAFIYRTSESTDMTLDRPWYEERIRRSIRVAGMLNIPWIVIHPADFCFDISYDFEKNRSFNLSYWAPFVDLAIQCGVGIAFENLYPSGRLPQRYCSDYQELIDLADSFNTDHVGICWDTGHAAVAGQDQPAALRAIGSRLKALHIHDNHQRAKGDEHLIPYLGTLNWDKILHALGEIGYDRTFSFEIKQGSAMMPPEMTENMLLFIHRLGLYMMDQIRSYAERSALLCG